MSNLFTILPFSVQSSNLSVVNSADFQRLQDFEFSAYEHWVFDRGDSSDLSGRINNKLLTAQSSAPIYHPSYLTVATDQGKALLTDLGEVTGQEDTIFVVFRHNYTGTSVVVPFGTIGASTDPAPVSGGSPFMSTATRDIYLTYRGSNISSTDTGKLVSANTWYFLAVSRKMLNGGSVRTLLGGSSAREDAVTTDAYIPAASGRKIALGSAYYNAIPAYTLDIAEAAVFNWRMTTTELGDLYARSKARMAARGITVV